MNYRLKLMFVMFIMPMLIYSQGRSYEGDVENVTVVDEIATNISAYSIKIPHIVQLKSDYLIVAYEEGIYGKTDMGDISVKISRDDGQNWSKKITIFDHTEKHGNLQFAYANPVLFKPEDQNLVWCFAMRNHLYQPNSEESYLVSAYSGDGGLTWHHVEPVMNYKGSLVLVGNVQVIYRDNKPIYLLPAHRNSTHIGPVKEARSQFILESKNLIEWDLLGIVPQPDEVWIHEGHVAIINNQQDMKMIMRTSTMKNKTLNPAVAWSSTSRDLGNTWSYPSEEIDLPNFVSEAAYGVTKNGIEYYIYNDTSSRMALKYKIKYKNDPNWSEPKTFYDAGIKNSYPSVIEVAPGDLRIVWDSGTDKVERQKIFYGKLRLDSNN